MKNWVVQCVRDYPDVSHTQIGKMFGVDRHSVSFWAGNRKRNPGIRKNWQKERSKETKHRLIQFLGGRCFSCGYDKCEAALDFHHKDPTQKRVMVSDLLCGNFEVAIEEAKKCVLLCANCHREQHDDEGSLGPNNLTSHACAEPIGGGDNGEHPQQVFAVF